MNPYAGNRKIHVATQKGPVRVGRPMGAKKAFMAACMKTVAIVPNIAYMAALHELLQYVAPRAMAVSTPENPYRPLAMS